MNIQKEKFCTAKAVVCATNELGYDWDIIVPDMKPDIGKILNSCAHVVISEKEIMQDRTVISGIVKINILYVSSEDDKTIRNIENMQNFTHVMELKGLRQSMILDVSSCVAEITENVINSRKINLAVKIKLCGTAYNDENMEFISEAEEDDVHCLCKCINTIRTSCVTSNDAVLKEEFDVPSGKPSVFEILKVKTSITNKSVKPLLNKLVVKGNMVLSVLYNAELDGLKFETMDFEMPFTEIFDIEGLTESSKCDTDFEIYDTNYFIKPNSDGDNRILVSETVLRVRTRAYENVCLNAVTDAYSITDNLKFETSKYDIDELLCEMCCDHQIKESVRFEALPPISKILNCASTAEIVSAVIKNGKICVEGNVKTEVLYASIDRDGFLNCAYFETPFSAAFDCEEAKEGMYCEVNTDILSDGYNITGDFELQIRMNIQLNFRVKKSAECELFKSLDKDEDNPCENTRADIVVYICDGNETMWDIAKKYRTTTERILTVNGLNDEKIKYGTKLIV
ncbi:MAG: DUF3794 domain-containing protein [Clostridia bacterium]|nr:DUF3794 domain-containing protein [Clostridia bacterium]